MTEHEEQGLLLLGIHSLLSLTQRRLMMIHDSYESIHDCVADRFVLIKEKEFDVVRPHSFDEILELGKSMNQELIAEGAKFCYVYSAEYPEQLKKIADSPVLLFYKGDITVANSKSQKFLACVGSRAMTPQTKIVINKLVSELQGQPVAIVSGLAAGVDSYTHLMSQQNRLSGIGVLGTSIFASEFYPLNNYPLAVDIVKTGGVIMSEYWKSEGGKRYSFVRRNRLIAGLSQAVFVIQASLKSGSVTTADFAVEFGRQLLTITGLPFDDAYLGNQELFRKGAKLVFDSSDILEVLEIKNPQAVLQKPATSQSQPQNHSETAQLILTHMSFSPVSIDMLMKLTELSLATLSQQLMVLELQGSVQNVGSNEWIKV